MTQPSASQNEPVSLTDQARVKDVVAEAILGLWDVVNNLTRLKPAQRERYRVTIFGSARVRAGSFGYEETKRLASELARMGCDIITGGGPGLMQAANEGAATAPERAHSVGIRVDLPFEQEINSFVGQAFEHRTFFTRLHQFVLTSDAFVVAPGGIGTVLRNADDLAAFASEASRADAFDSRWKYVAGLGRVDKVFDACSGSTAGEFRGP